MSKIVIDDCLYKIHPIYDLYAANKRGQTINIVKKKPLLGNNDSNGYMACGVRKYQQKDRKIVEFIVFLRNVFMMLYQKIK